MVVPKFRVWDVHNKKMFTESELVIWNGNVYANDYQKIFKMFMEGARGLVGYSVDDKYLMQSTGLFDKNGKEIFEGDVVKLKYTVLSDYEFFKVTRFRGGSWRIDNRQRGSELWLRNEDCEIIGNIHRNSELMEEVNND